MGAKADRRVAHANFRLAPCPRPVKHHTSSASLRLSQKHNGPMRQETPNQQSHLCTVPVRPTTALPPQYKPVKLEADTD